MRGCFGHQEEESQQFVTYFASVREGNEFPSSLCLNRPERRIFFRKGVIQKELHSISLTPSVSQTRLLCRSHDEKMKSLWKGKHTFFVDRRRKMFTRLTAGYFPTFFLYQEERKARENSSTFFLGGSEMVTKCPPSKKKQAENNRKTFLCTRSL